MRIPGFETGEIGLGAASYQLATDYQGSSWLNYPCSSELKYL